MTHRPDKPRSFALTVYGPPRPLLRPRFANGRAYDPIKNKHAKKSIASAARAKLFHAQPKTIFTGPLCAQLTFYLPKPKSKIRKNSTPYPYPDCKPDIDNLEKLIYDALNGIVYKDDGQIIDAILKKRWAYDREPCVEIVITEIR